MLEKLISVYRDSWAKTRHVMKFRLKKTLMKDHEN